MTAAAALLSAGLGVGALAVAPTSMASSAGQPIDGCTESNEWVEGIEVKPRGDGDFTIKLTPTHDARVLGAAPDNVLITNSMWALVQGCVTGLYGSLADSIWQQLDCHRLYGWVPDPREGNGSYLSGPTYDLESTKPPLTEKSRQSGYLVTSCLNYERGWSLDERWIDPGPASMLPSNIA